MLAILSSAKTMDFSPWLTKIEPTEPYFPVEVKDLVLLLREYKLADLSKLMGLSAKLSELNYQRFQDFNVKLKQSVGKPAIFAYQGDVYQGFDVESLKLADLKFAQEHLRIISGLYGMLRPLDAVQAYRLEMATKLRNPAGKDLYAFWQEKVTRQINQEIKKHKSPILLNLASEEYSKAVRLKELSCQMINVVFKQRTGTQLKNVGLFAKQARGQMARAICQNRWDKLSDLRDFSDSGYRYEPKLSDSENLIFTRKWK